MFRFSIPSMLRGTGMLLLLTLYIEFSDANRGRDEWNRSDYTWLLVCFGWIITIFVAGLLAALFVGPSPEPLKDKYCKGWAENNS